MNLEQLKEVIVAALPNCNPDAVTLEAQIVPDVCADSLDTVELSMAIEDKLGVSMPDGPDGHHADHRRPAQVFAGKQVSPLARAEQSERAF